LTEPIRQFLNMPLPAWFAEPSIEGGGHAGANSHQSVAAI
jgi:hypothetical protein